LIRVAVTPADLADVRVRTSPLVEASAALRLLRRETDEPVLARWSTEARSALRRRPTPLLDALHEPGRYVPDFIPPPPEPGDAFERELRALEAVPAAHVVYHLRFAYPDGVPADVRALATEPRTSLRRLAEELRLFWDGAIARVWAGCRAVVEGDLLVRARELAVEGPEALLAGLHPDVSYRDGVLEIASETDSEIELRGNGIALVPSVFTDSVRVVTNPDLRLGIAYSPRGLAALDESRSDADRLAVVVGAPRAQLLRRLREPASTQELAVWLGVTPSAVSQRLGPLADAGIVGSSRVGRRVYHRLTDEGRALLELFDAASG